MTIRNESRPAAKRKRYDTHASRVDHMNAYKTEFLELALELGVLKFGEFTLKSGRTSPYFFNAGLFNSGYAAAKLGRCYASAIAALDLEFDMLFGPAYKGIPLVAAVAVTLAQAGHNKPYSFNRKEMKDHGEGGSIIGAALAGRVLVVDDAISAGTAVRESYDIIRSSRATPCAVMVALDRMERGVGELSAVQEVERTFGIPVISIATLDDLVSYLESDPGHKRDLAAVNRYREQYGVKAHA